MSGFRLDGKAVLLTGARAGIGGAIATALAQAGARVMLANRTVAAAEEVAQQVRGLGGEAHVTAFSADEDGCRAAVAAAVAALGSLNILIHNAGGCQWTPLETLSAQLLESTLALNLKCCFWLTQAALPALRRGGGGRVLITSSVTGPRVVMARAAHYAAAKAGVNGFIRAAALELAADRITVNGVEPGFVAKGRGRLNEPQARERIERYIPLGTLGSPADVAGAFVYLASEAARWITGQTIVVDGGSTLPDSGFAMEELW